MNRLPINLLAACGFLVGLLACSPVRSASPFDDLPPQVADNARAIDLRQTAVAAQDLAERARAQATDAVRQQLQVEGRLTAVALATRDTLNVRATTIAQDATATAVIADANATSEARANAQTATVQVSAINATATARLEQREGTATAISNSQTATASEVRASATAQAATATQVSAQATATVVAVQAAATATRTANLVREENERTLWNNRLAPLREILWALVPLAVLLAIAVFFALLGFIAWRAFVLFEQKRRVMPQANGMVVLVLPSSVWGGPPEIKFIPPPSVPLLESPMSADKTIIEPAFSYRSLTLELAAQPRPLYVPLGMNEKHPDGWWVSLVDLDSTLIAGTRRMGKSNFLHTWIQALIHGRSVRLVLYDGKGGVEFGRYANAPRTQLVEDLPPALGELQLELGRRIRLFRNGGVSNIGEYNQAHGTGGRLERIVLIIDELAFALQQDGVEQVLADLIARGGAFGLHPVLASQHPSSDVITPLIKANLSTRIAFKVPTQSDSRVILDRSGAERLPGPGRLLLVWNGELVEAQAFKALDELPGVSRSRIVGWSQPALTNAILNEREMKLARTAIQELGGWFKQRELAKATGESTRYVGEVALRWQSLGYLTPVQREQGLNRGRRLTERLIHLVAG